MGALASAQAASSYLEKLRSAAGILFERDDVLLSKFEKNADTEEVSPRSMRINLKIRPGGKGGQFNADGGNMGRGSGTTRVEATISPIFFKFACEVNKLVEYATNSKNKAVENAAKDEFKHGMAQFRAFLDKIIQTAGDCVLGNITLVTTNTLWTMGAPYYTQLFYFNQTITVYDATLATNRGTANITLVDPDNLQITVDAKPAGTVATDLVLWDGVSGANPVGIFGLKYHQSNAATGTWLNLNRALYPEIRAPRVNANNSALVTGHARLALNKVRKALGVKATAKSKLVAYAGLEQIHAWEQLGITMSTLMRQGAGGEKGFDPLFGEGGNIAGVPVEASINADPTRIDFLALANWVRVVIKDIDFYEQGSQTVFPPMDTSTGGLVAAYLFYYVFGFQLANQNPRMGAFIDQLPKPTGY
jgi:phage tail protein X